MSAPSQLTFEDFHGRLSDKNYEDLFHDTVRFVNFRQLLRDQRAYMQLEDFHWIVYEGKPSLFFYRPAKISLAPRVGYDVSIVNHDGLFYALFLMERAEFMEHINKPGTQQFLADLAPKGGIADFPLILFPTSS